MSSATPSTLRPLRQRPVRLSVLGDRVGARAELVTGGTVSEPDPEVSGITLDSRLVAIAAAEDDTCGIRFLPQQRTDRCI